MIKVLVHASEILTGSGVRLKDGRKVGEEDLGRIEDGAVVYSVKRRGKKEIPDRIEWVGKTSELPKSWVKLKKTDLKGERAIVPGLVDCHNHLIFSGSRANEFSARCAGATYEQIAQQGGGILSTVRSTRMATERELEQLATQRLAQLFAQGVRTVEIKSGYGLSSESELKILKVIPRLRKRFPEMTLRATFLGAHAFPPDQTRASYVREIVEVMLPQVSQQGLADSCDVFIDSGYFTLSEGRKILTKAQKLGLKIKVHADELSRTDASVLAAQMGALSADHLLQISQRGIEALAGSQTVAVLLPGTAFFLQRPQAPARKLIDAGACVAIATDFNPGTCFCLSLPAILTIAALQLGLSSAELFAAVTYNAAKALGLEQSKGTIEPGRDADFWVMPFTCFEEVYYRLAWAF
ncbi:MAG: imidazolonepropionase [Bdellovibrionia bacterium]